MHGGCYPVGAREYDCQKEFDDVKITDFKWPKYSPILNITIYVPYGPNGVDFNDHHCVNTGNEKIKSFHIGYMMKVKGLHS
ncbi:hypothetical protein RhiirA5_414860 [Rhizophagus irregularis]|uniref:Uncharacterized protein n=2 Tax=Rhizophagus irregularis TaxID=588596 RepID=A0A2N0PT67_9GLOM|nr:hypothetical protein RhiirA5_414860 [Rhizophagus irregularis]